MDWTIMSGDPLHLRHDLTRPRLADWMRSMRRCLVGTLVLAKRGL